MSTNTPLPDLTALLWQKHTNGTTYRIDTARQNLDIDFISHAFSTDDMHWARPLSREEMSKTLDNCLTLGLYQELPALAAAKSVDEPSSPRTPSPTLENDPMLSSGSDVVLKQVGMARLITDHVTFAYLTDVYIAPEHRRFGLARWLMACLLEVLDLLPAIRRVMLITGLEYGAKFYKETLGCHDVAEDTPGFVTLTRKFTTH